MPASDPANHRFYARRAWQKARQVVLDRDGGLCVMCAKIGIDEPAIEVDHILPLATHPHLALDIANCQSLCKAHHGKKGAADRSDVPMRCVHGYEIGSGVCC